MQIEFALTRQQSLERRPGLFIAFMAALTDTPLLSADDYPAVTLSLVVMPPEYVFYCYTIACLCIIFCNTFSASGISFAICGVVAILAAINTWCYLKIWKFWNMMI